jgi:3-oxoacyl-ACP reductase-like protein
LNIIVAQKLKEKVEEVPVSKSIKDLVGGKPTLQNEILGDLQIEFASAPEKWVAQLVVHLRFLFGVLEPSAYETYKCKNVVRAQQAYKSMSEMMITNSLIKHRLTPQSSRFLCS